MSLHDFSRRIENSSLSAFIELLRDRCDAITQVQGGDTYYIEELEIFKQVARDQGYLLDKIPEPLNSPCHDSGNEHEVWFVEEHSLYLKATWPDHFGMKVIHLPHEEPKASPIHYLERWDLHNKILGDSVDFLGAIYTPQGLRMIISQPAILGEPSTDEQINAFFLQKGWDKIEINSDIAYYDKSEQVLVSDTHKGNIVLVDSGLLIPIDLRVQKLKPLTIDLVKSLLAQQ